MKVLLIALCLVPSTIFAQETHREATSEERKIILPENEEKKLKELGIQEARESELNIMNEALIRQAHANGKLDETQLKGYVQKLTDHGLPPEKIKQEIENLILKYFAKLQVND